MSVFICHVCLVPVGLASLQPELRRGVVSSLLWVLESKLRSSGTSVSHFCRPGSARVTRGACVCNLSVSGSHRTLGGPEPTLASMLPPPWKREGRGNLRPGSIGSHPCPQCGVLPRPPSSPWLLSYRPQEPRRQGTCRETPTEAPGPGRAVLLAHLEAGCTDQASSEEAVSAAAGRLHRGM